MSKAAWQLAEATHVGNLDIEALIAEMRSASARDYAELFFLKAKDLAEQSGQRHVLVMLGSLLQMHMKSGEATQPYGAMMRLEDRRTAEPGDFVGAPVEAMVACAEVIQNPIVLARICDVAWMLERKRRDVGMSALKAYIESANKLQNGELNEDHGDGLVGLSGYDILRRALFVSRGLGRPEPEHGAVKALVENCRKQAGVIPGLNFLRRFSELDLDWGASNPAEVGDLISRVSSEERPEASGYVEAELWIVGSRAYHLAKDLPKELECQAQAAESYVKAANAFIGTPGGAMQAAHWLSMAISQYHGHPQSQARRKELKHLLVDVQEGIRDELQSFSMPMDLREIVEAVEKDFDDLALVDLLLLFADLDRSPSPKKLIEEARKSVAESPLASMFAASYMDREGKTVAKSPGVDLGREADLSTLLPAINRAEGVRRNILARSTIDVARNSIMQQHFLSVDQIAAFLGHSPAIPPDLHMTIASGFLRFFEADHVSALHILTPMLEGILRHILKSAGHDVSTFDNATGTQEDRTISSLFDAMRAELDEVFGRALTDDIDRVFLSKFGPSIRHAVAHALHHDGMPYSADAIYANWLIWRICCIPILRYRDEIQLP